MQRWDKLPMTTYVPHSTYPTDAALTRGVLLTVAISSYWCDGAKTALTAISDHVARRTGIPEAAAVALIRSVHRAGMVALTADGARVGVSEAGRAWLRSRGDH